jgi:hypothetical protein
VEGLADGEVLSVVGVVEAWLSFAAWMMTGVSPKATSAWLNGRNGECVSLNNQNDASS